MGKDPAFLFYPNDWLGGTIGMSFEIQGAYLTLLILQFNKGEFNEIQANNTIGPVRWAELKEKFETNGTVFWNTRLKDEHDKRKNYSVSRSKNRKKPENISSSYVKHMEDENENRNESLNRVESKLAEFYEYRKSIRKPIHEASKEAFLKKLNNLSGGIENKKIDILEQSIANSWQGIFELRSGTELKLVNKILSGKKDMGSLKNN